jgi:hypothetical protein
MDEAMLKKILDRMEISDTVIRYATGVDMRDWETYRSCFTDEIEIDFSSWSKDLSSRLKADDWVDMVRKTLTGFEATQHISSNHVIELNGDEATCTSYVQAQHYLPNNQGHNAYTLGGYYTNHLLRTPGGWKISKCKLTVTWTDGNRHVFDLARERLT